MLVGMINRITFGMKEIAAVAAKAFRHAESELPLNIPIPMIVVW